MMTAGFFLWGDPVFSSAEDLVITEIMYNPEGTDTGHTDWIELYNPTSSAISIPKSSFGLIDESVMTLGKDGTHYLNCHGIDRDLAVDPGAFVILADKAANFETDYSDNSSELFDGTFSLSSDGDTIRVSRDKCSTFFVDLQYQPEWGGSDNGRTIEKKKYNADYSAGDWQESFVPGGTPGGKNSEKPKPKVYTDKLRINEILPNPKEDEEKNEFIEIYNDSLDLFELDGWKLKDSSAGDGFIFAGGSKIDPEGFRTIYRTDFKFALNNSGTDSVHLIDPNGKEVSMIEYKDSPEGVSYGLDRSKWRWSKYLTPGEENIFDDAPDFEIKKDKDVFKNLPANFEVKVKKYKKGKTKITWNFGDGHKSYKQKTNHKYEKKGKYKASVEIFNGSEEVTKNFEVKVENFPKYDVEIISLVPNPKGSDADFETITLRNNSKKKINLQGWSIAVGDKKLTNHPIAQKIILKSKSTVTITRGLSKFSLNNKKAKIELRYPNGKVAFKMNYDKKSDSAAEGEILEKTKLGWVWKNTLPVKVVPESSLLAVASESDNQSAVLGESDTKEIPEEMWGGQSEMGSKKDYRLVFAEYIFSSFVHLDFGITNQSRVKPALNFATLF